MLAAVEGSRRQEGTPGERVHGPQRAVGERGPPKRKRRQNGIEPREPAAGPPTREEEGAAREEGARGASA